MSKSKLRTYTLDEIKDEFIGKKGSSRRDIYEQELHMDVLGEMIRSLRLERNLTQEQLGELIGVQKAQISKLENKAMNVTIETLLRVFTALKAKVTFKVEIEKNV